MATTTATPETEQPRTAGKATKAATRRLRAAYGRIAAAGGLRFGPGTGGRWYAAEKALEALEALEVPVPVTTAQALEDLADDYERGTRPFDTPAAMVTPDDLLAADATERLHAFAVDQAARALAPQLIAELVRTLNRRVTELLDRA